MKFIKRVLLGLIFAVTLTTMGSVMIYADDIGDVGNTGQGGVGGTNPYTFHYNYDEKKDAIVLTITAPQPMLNFNDTKYTFKGPDDHLEINAQGPTAADGERLEDAINSMIDDGLYDLSPDIVKQKLKELGYTDEKYPDIWMKGNTFLTYVEPVKIWPQKHTVQYDADGGSGAPEDQTKYQSKLLYLSSTKPSRTGYTFKYWKASIGGKYSPGQKYTHDQDGGEVTMTAHWEDDTKPDCSAFSATPNQWSAGNGTVTFSAQDEGSGLSSVVLERYSDVTGLGSIVKKWSYNGTTSKTTESYVETLEGVFYYILTIKDVAGNVTTKTSASIYLDHSNPVIGGVEDTVTEWTNVAPVIRVSATDYLNGTNYTGSGLKSLIIKDDSGNVVASGVTGTSYTLAANYEGIHTWYITATDRVGHSSSRSVTTKYDRTSPGVDGTEITFVRPDGVTVSGYCQDNIINQHIDDEISRSPNGANVSSGIRSVILYRVTGGQREVINSNRTKAIFDSSDTHSYFDMYYEITAAEKNVNYYEIIVMDFAGNKTTKKLTSQYSLLSWFHTSIDRSSYH